jgi:predicted permease
VPVFRTLSILAGMAFPMALLLIGAGLAFDQMLPAGRELLSSGLFKLVLLPLIGWLLLFALQVPRDSMLPVLILLACPPATVTYVFATSMNGDPELAAAVISSHTLLSALAYSVLFYLFAVG